ncbi:hypothetical protein FRB94_008293 [Tulasnella sp. JGI-2019a]|nr:hypothetical protein FRB94_008293 [Tulasnella sp. JGI-2019a]
MTWNASIGVGVCEERGGFGRSDGMWMMMLVDAYSMVEKWSAYIVLLCEGLAMRAKGWPATAHGKLSPLSLPATLGTKARSSPDAHHGIRCLQAETGSGSPILSRHKGLVL